MPRYVPKSLSPKAPFSKSKIWIHTTQFTLYVIREVKFYFGP